MRTLQNLAALALLLASAVASAQLPTAPSSKLQGNLQNQPTLPPLAIANTSTRAIPVLVAPNNSLPAVNVEIRTTGGIAPVEFTIVGGSAAPMFQILSTQTQEITRVLTPAEESAAAMAARFERRPAGTVTRTLRFLGTANAGALTSPPIVQVRARDAVGASVTMSVTAYPFAPHVAPINFNLTAHQTWPLNLSVQGLGNATHMRVDSVGGGCNYVQNNEIGYGNPVVTVASGVANVSRVASFRTTASACNALRLTIAVRFPDTPDFTTPVTITVPPFSFRAPQLYSFNRTWELQEAFGFALRTSHTGVCSGESTGTAGTFPAGVFKSSDDITFGIRSGPLGTECDFGSLARRLPDGFVLSKLEFTKAEGANNSPTPVVMGEPKRYCRIGGSGGTVGGVVKYDLTRGMNSLSESELFAASGPPLADFALAGFDRPLVTGDGVPLVTGNDTSYAVVLIPMYLKLRCVITPSNTEFYALRLDRVELLGPPGVKFP
jgi:hypothetical protein